MAECVVLFVCVGNSCRSPMAEAMARVLGGGRVEARSAGLAPAGFISPSTVVALTTLGYSDDGLRSKGIDEMNLEDVDVVVSLLGSRGLHHVPPQYGAWREAWDVRDPFGDDEELYLAVAREIEARVRRLLEDLADEELPLP